ncbi:MAG: hypothetical protein ACOC7P_00585 [Chloroflexota bacterium]
MKIGADTRRRQFQKLLQPARIGGLELRNHIVMLPITDNYCDAEGYVTQRMKDFYGERAKGGVGLIIVGHACIDLTRARGGLYQLGVDSDKFIPGLTELVETIHNGGAKAALQLHHSGGDAQREYTNRQPTAASAVIIPEGQVPKSLAREVARELMVKEIVEIITLYARAAKRAKDAGFDGIEVHAADKALLASFLSPFLNKRHDRYGGDLKKRARFLLEVIEAIKESVGEAYPIWCRINVVESWPGGVTLSQSQELAEMLQDVGCYAIETCSYQHKGITSVAPYVYPLGWGAPLAQGIQEVVNIPVIYGLGRLDAKVGEEILRDKKASLIGMARPLIAEPELPNKLASGKLEDIRPCIGCCLCLSEVRGRKPMVCAVNPSVGNEQAYMMSWVARSKKFVVVGGGCAGKEAAPKTDGPLILGGLINVEIDELNNYLSSQIRKIRVKVQLRRKVMPSLIKGLKLDVIILASGATGRRPEFWALRQQMSQSLKAVVVGYQTGVRTA